MEKVGEHWNRLPWEAVKHLGGVQETAGRGTECWGLGVGSKVGFNPGLFHPW